MRDRPPCPDAAPLGRRARRRARRRPPGARRRGHPRAHRAAAGHRASGRSSRSAELSVDDGLVGDNWRATGQPPHRGRLGRGQPPAHDHERAGDRLVRRRPFTLARCRRPALRRHRPVGRQPAAGHPPAHRRRRRRGVRRAPHGLRQVPPAVRPRRLPPRQHAARSRAQPPRHQRAGRRGGNDQAGRRRPGVFRPDPLELPERPRDRVDQPEVATRTRTLRIAFAAPCRHSGLSS